jgi:hypothetical protein
VNQLAECETVGRASHSGSYRLQTPQNFPVRRNADVVFGEVDSGFE